ncbi:MAG: hypothetical protein KatS3mg105_5037 [Gemmatales bacterium]|nr:MAG: hypothetical protein KatS3mg105_5037 [Gemmatales bacterium]
MAELRSYQLAAVDAAMHHVSSGKSNPCVVLPTGSGKSYVIAELCRRAQQQNKRVMVLAHVRELLEQNAEKIRSVDPTLDVGIYSAGLGRRENDKPALVASIQSVYWCPEILGRRDLVIVDEAHLIPEHQDSMYRRVLEHFRCPLVGLTATPYRMTSGTICRQEGPIHEVAYEAGIQELVQQGYLSQVISMIDLKDLDFSELKLRGGEFIAKEAEEMMSQDQIVRKAVARILQMTSNRQSVIVFCSGAKHAEKVLEELRAALGEKDSSALVLGTTPGGIRSEIISRFKKRELKFLLNVNVLTTGFDAPNIDAICLLRPTMSPGLYYQMIGRGLRKCEDKTNCLVLDFAGNVRRHGPIDAIIPPVGSDERSSKNGSGERIKICPKCEVVNSKQALECVHCDYVFLREEEFKPKHSSDLTNVAELSKPVDVFFELWTIHVKRKESISETSRTVRIDFHTKLGIISHWLAPEHGPFCLKKTLDFFRKRGVLLSEPPRTVDACLRLFYHPNLRKIKTLYVSKPEHSKYWNIVDFSCE